MKKWLCTTCLALLCALQAAAHSSLVLYNPLGRLSNTTIAQSMPMQFVEIDGQYVADVLPSHYVEVLLTPGRHVIAVYQSRHPQFGFVYTSYEEAKRRSDSGTCIVLAGTSFDDHQTLYLNTATHLFSTDKKFQSLLSGKHPIKSSPQLSMLPKQETNTQLATTTTTTTTTTQPTAPSDVDTRIPQTGRTSDRTFAIILANEDYQFVSPVPFALNDGRIFSQYCRQTLGLPEQNIHLRENATLNHLRAELTWIEQVCQAYEGTANVIIYYAGHGIPDEQNHSSYLLPVDGMGTDVASAYAINDLYQRLGALQAQSVTVFMDACFSGSKREEGMLSSARGVAIKARPGLPTGNTIVFSAAQADETAYPHRLQGHGLFTYFLLKKLQETRGQITLYDLGEYIRTQVRQQSIVQNGKSQTPSVSASADLGTDWQSFYLTPEK